MNCIVCKADLGRTSRGSIAVLVSGDERIHSWFWCEPCGVYTGEEFHDRFLGDSDVYVFGPVDKDEGSRVLALIAECPNPSNKFCTCKSHEALHHPRI